MKLTDNGSLGGLPNNRGQDNRLSIYISLINEVFDPRLALIFFAKI